MSSPGAAIDGGRHLCTQRRQRASVFPGPLLAAAAPRAQGGDRADPPRHPRPRRHLRSGMAPYHPDADDFGLLEPPSLHIRWAPTRSDAICSAASSSAPASRSPSGSWPRSSRWWSGGLLGLSPGTTGGGSTASSPARVDLLWAFPVIILAGGHRRHLWRRVPQCRHRHRGRVLRRLRPHRARRNAQPARGGLHHGRPGHWRARPPDHVSPHRAEPDCTTHGATHLRRWPRDPDRIDADLPRARRQPVHARPGAWRSNEGRDFVKQAWWISVFPGLAIVITVMALNLFGDGLRDALDVRGVSDV